MQGVKKILSISGRQLRGLWKSFAYSFLEMLFVIFPYVLVIYTLKTLQPGINGIHMKAFHYFLIMLGCVAVRLFFRWRGYLNTQILGVNFSTDLRQKIGDHYRHLSLGYFNGKDLGELSGEMIKSVTDVENIVTQVFSNSLLLIAGLLLFMTGLFFVDIRLALSVIAMIIIAVPFLFISNKMAIKYGKENQKAAFETSDKVLEYIYGIRTIKSYNLGIDRLEKTKEAVKTQYKTSIKLEFKVAPLVQAFGGIIDTALPVGMLAAIALVNGGYIENLRALSFFLSAPRIFTMIFLLSVMFTELRIALNSVESLTDILNEQVQSSGEEGIPSSLDIAFHDVSFSYKNERVLDDISFSIPEGSFTAIVGPSGSGKTTIANLIARFWDVERGSITMGCMDIRKIETDKLLSRMSFVFQNVFLFKDSIYNNITLGDNSAYDEKQVIAAMKAAGVLELTRNLPDGYNTIVGEGGATLSGGEKQRLSIARALLKDAPILVLDEATASLDAENEYIVQQAFNKLMKNKTLIVIAHRLSTIELANQILVLTEDGHMAEMGQHNELIAKKGLYYNLWTARQEALGWSL